MKYLLTVFLFLAAATVNGQTNTKVSLLKFASKEFKVPAGCSAESAYQIKCDDFTMVWLYMTEPMLNTMPEQAIGQLSVQLKDFKKDPVPVFLLGDEAKGYRISYMNEVTKKPGYQIVAYGMANGQPVLVQIVLNKEPKSDVDLPEFSRQIVRLSK